MVVYEPLYASDWFYGVQYATRPLSMRNETVERQGERRTRFVLED